MAEEDPDNPGSFSHPLREVPGDRTSDRIGTLFGVTIGPELTIVGEPTGRLLVDVHGEYTIEVLPDPDFHLRIYMKPVIEDGLLRWEVEPKVDVSLLGSLLGILGIVAGTLLFGPGVGVTLFLILLAADLITDAVATAIAADRADSLADASFLDALPHRVPVASRRWDPFYATDHEVVALLDGFTVDLEGLAFAGTAVLDKEPRPVTHVVVRDEERGGDGSIDALRYRVRDLAAIAGDLQAVAPGTDRRAFTLVGSDAEADLVAVTLGQIQDRIAEKRIVNPILYMPAKVHLEHNTIDELLVVSHREADEQRSALVRAFRSATDAEIRADQDADIAAEETEKLRDSLGREPTQDEVDDAVDARVTELVDEAEAAYEDDGLPADLAAAVDRILRFDAAPHELAALQDGGVLVLAGKEIIRMRSGTVYYRDHPDFVFADNLLALEHYHPPYTPGP